MKKTQQSKKSEKYKSKLVRSPSPPSSPPLPSAFLLPGKRTASPLARSLAPPLPLTKQANGPYELSARFPASRARIGAWKAIQGLSEIFDVRLQNDEVQHFHVRWDRALSTSDMLSDVILEGLYKSQSQDSLQLQTVLALYDQETVRNNGQTSYFRLKTSVKLRIDQMRRTHNFRVRSEVVERGAVTKSSMGKKTDIEMKVECFQKKAHGPCSKGDSCSLSWRTSLWRLAVVRDEKDDRLLRHQVRRPRPQRGKLFRQKGAKFYADTNREHQACKIWRFPATSLKLGAHQEEHVSSEILTKKESMKKSRKRWCERISCKKGSGARFYQKNANFSPCAENWGKIRREDPGTRRMRPQGSVGFGEKYLQAQEFRQNSALYSN